MPPVPGDAIAPVLELNMRRATCFIAVAGIALLVLSGCQSRPTTDPQPLVYSNCRSMPLAVGDGVGTAVFTTRQSLAMRGIQSDTRTASVSDSPR